MLGAVVPVRIQGGLGLEAVVMAQLGGGEPRGQWLRLRNVIVSKMPSSEPFIMIDVKSSVLTIPPTCFDATSRLASVLLRVPSPSLLLLCDPFPLLQHASTRTP